MNAKRIAQIIEVLFQGGPGDEAPEPPEPLNKRFQWKDPKTGKPPPTPPKDMLPTEKDFQGLDTEFFVPPGHESPPVGRYEAPRKPAAPVQGPEAPLDDRTGSVPMSQMMPKSEIATIDHLLDRYLAMQKTHGPEAAKRWFDNYRTAEFESLVRRMVESMLGEAVCDFCGREVGNDFFTTGKRNEQIICGGCHVSGKNKYDMETDTAWTNELRHPVTGLRSFYPSRSRFAR